MLSSHKWKLIQTVNQGTDLVSFQSPKNNKGQKAVQIILNMISVNILVCKFSVAAATSQSPFWQVFTLNVNADLIFSVLWKCRRMKILSSFTHPHAIHFLIVEYNIGIIKKPPQKTSQYIANRGVTHSWSLKTRQNEHDSKPCDPSLWINVPWRETRCVWEKY